MAVTQRAITMATEMTMFVSWWILYHFVHSRNRNITMFNNPAYAKYKPI